MTSSPRYAQANSDAERTVRTMKGLLKCKEDQHIALMTYRVIPLQNGQSPAELLMGRRLHTLLPVLLSTLMLRGKIESLQRTKTPYCNQQTRNFNKRHDARDRPGLQSADPVWIRYQNRDGQVVGRTPEPQSYLVKTNTGTVSRILFVGLISF